MARSDVEDWRILGHAHGDSCGLIVIEQTPAPGHVIARHGHPVRVTLRLRRG